MKPTFIPKTLGGKLNWLAEECAELGQAIAKTQRFREEKGVTLTQALHFFDPTVPDNLRETNHAWILRELADLKQAIALFEATPIPCCEGNLSCGFKPHETFTCYRCKRLRCFCMGADGHIDCIDCWAKRQKPSSKKKPHAKKQSQQAQSKSPKKVRSKKARVTARKRAREYRPHPNGGLAF
jgi:hypothetical protein